MPRGGKRKGAGRKKGLPPEAEALADKGAAARILTAVFGPKPHVGDECKCELCFWWLIFWAQDLTMRERAAARWYDKRDGKAVQTVNHVHDKPIDLNVNVSMADVIREVRQRKAAYERSRK